MLSEAGIETATAASGMTAFTLLQFATVAVVPVLLLPAVLLGILELNPSLNHALLLGALAFLAIFAVGRGAGRVRRAVARRRPRRAGDPQPGAPFERADGRPARPARGGAQHARPHARPALAPGGGAQRLPRRSSTTSRCSRPSPPSARIPRPSLIVVAYVSAVVLALIPITPGGLGFVEAGLTGVLTLAGIPASDAVLATLLYRLAAYWIPMIAGPFAYVLFRVSRRRLQAQSGGPDIAGGSIP